MSYGAPDVIYSESNEAVLNPAFYARRFKPQALWNEAEKDAYAADPTFEPEGYKWT